MTMSDIMTAIAPSSADRCPPRADVGDGPDRERPGDALESSHEAITGVISGRVFTADRSGMSPPRSVARPGDRLRGAIRLVLVARTEAPCRSCESRSPRRVEIQLPLDGGLLLVRPDRLRTSRRGPPPPSVPRKPRADVRIELDETSLSAATPNVWRLTR